MMRRLALPIALAAGLLACDDAVVPPTDADAVALQAALVPGEHWEVFTVAKSEGAAAATGINESGQVVGTTLVHDTVRAYVRQANGTVVLLPYHGSGGTGNHGLAINDQGVVAGMTDDFHGLRWTVAFGGWKVSPMPIDLNKPAVVVHDINDDGWVVGSAAPNIGSPATEAFVQRPGEPIQLIGGVPSLANAINSAGTVFGGTELPGGDARAFT